MSIVALRALLETAVNAIAPALPIAWENVVFTPVAKQPYMRCDLLLIDPVNPTIAVASGPQLVRQAGILQLTLKYPMGAGSGAAITQADIIAALFAYGKQFASGGMTVTVSRTPTIAPGRVDGDRWSVPVKISFFANFFQ